MERESDMGNSTVIQKYIEKCENVLKSEDANEAHSLIGEIISVFASSIDKLKSGLDSYVPGTFASFGGITITTPPPDYLADIRKLKGKLEIEMEKASCIAVHVKDEEGVVSAENKPYKIFISHSSKDKPYVSKLVKLIEEIGVQEKCMFCSSVEGYDIPLGENIYNFLRTQFNNFQLHVIFALSENYYQSAACLNEMGAAWVLRQSYTSILLPGFTYKQIEGAVDPRDIALKLDEDEKKVNQRLYELMEQLCKKFEIETPSSSKWERIREEFKEAIK